MLNAIIRFSVRNKLIIGLCTLGLMIWGVLELKKLPIDALPDITSNQVQVITVSPSLAAPEVERLVTFPIEQANANIPGIVEMRSISRFGLSVVTVVFNDATDIYWARQQVSERLGQVKDQIPASAGRPELAPATTGLGEIYQYVLRPKNGYESKYDLTELRSIQDWIVRRQLLGTPGVADVSSFGGYLKQYEIAVKPDRLKSMNITIADIFSAVEKNNQNSGGAYIEKGPTSLFIRTEGLVKTKEEINKIFVKHTSAGIPVFVSDVAEVRIGHAIRYGAMTYNDKGEVAGAVVLMLKGANASDVIQNVKERIEQIKKTLPEGVVLEPFYDRTKMVNNAIGTVKTNLIEGALIVIFVLVIFLGNLRAGLIVASVIPLAMLFAVIMMNVFGVSGNLMSLGALDFGLIVDGAVIIVEAVLHRLAHNKHFDGHTHITQPQMNDEVQSSAGKMMNSAVFGQIIILIVYLPILTLTGIEGKMFKPMAQTVSFALIGAFLLSLTYVPMMSSLVLSKKLSHKDTFADKMITWFYNLYKPTMEFVLRYSRLFVIWVIFVFVVAIFVLTRLGGEFIPKLQEGDFAVDARILTGSSLTESIKTSQKAAAILKKNFPEVEKIVTRIGASEIPTDPMPVEMTDIIITLKPISKWTSASNFEELANKMSKALQDIPGMTSGFQFPVQMRFNELISGARQDVVCKIFGEDLDSLSVFANKLSEVVRKVKGAKDIYVEVVTGLPQIVVKYNREAIARYRMNIADIDQVIKTAFAGESAGTVYENERRYDLVLRLQEDARQDLTDVQQLLIPAPDGQQVPLYQVASVEIKEGPNQIQREDAKRRIIVGFNVRGRDVETVVNELNEKTGNELALPSGYYIKYGGQFENLVEAKQRLSVAVPAALLLILVMLYFAFGSLKHGLLIFSAIPLSAIGGVFALWIRGMPFSISAGVGFIALFGVAVLNGIVLISEFNRLKQHGLNDLKLIIMEGTKTRMRPVLMTAAVASLGFLPMAISHGPGAEVQRPLATVVIGGLISATFLTLVILPVFYNWFEKKKKKKSKIKPVSAVILLLLFTNAVSAQRHVSLDEMLKIATEKNQSVQLVKKGAAYWKELQDISYNPGKTQLGAEYGNINSLNNDTRFYISQPITMPLVYRRQKDLYKANEYLQLHMADVKTAELLREIKLVFYQLIDLSERKKLLARLDSIYSRFQHSAALRLKAGEANMLEKTAAHMQLQQIKMQQQEADADIAISQQKLKWLLNTDEGLLPLYSDPKREISQSINSDSAGHTLVKQYQLQKNVYKAETETEKSALLPDISVGYSNMSIIGYQSPDGISQKYFGGSDRFNIYSLSAGIPLFNKSVKARVKAGSVNQQVAEMAATITSAQLANKRKQGAYELNKQQNNLRYYEQGGLQQAALIMKNAGIGYEKGEIGYPEWSLLMNNAVAIQLAYIDAVNRYNNAIIEIEYLNGK
ncbi:MAG: CusA/CzcA family heavy metal efflux RND transporter [Chitinophagaceae bacterium]